MSIAQPSEVLHGPYVDQQYVVPPDWTARIGRLQDGYVYELCNPAGSSSFHRSELDEAMLWWAATP